MNEKISEYQNDIDGFKQKEVLLIELERLQKIGVCGATPPILGLLVAIGYFENKSVLVQAIQYLKQILGVAHD